MVFSEVLDCWLFQRFRSIGFSPGLVSVGLFKSFGFVGFLDRIVLLVGETNWLGLSDDVKLQRYQPIT